MTTENQTSDIWGQDNLGIFAYGSLLYEPGEEIARHIVARIPKGTPWPVEYARSSKSRGGGPTLVIHAMGAPVNGVVLVLDLKSADIEIARRLLRQREGTSNENIATTNVKELDTVLFAKLPSNIGDSELNPEHLAKLAIDSVSTDPDRNGIRYLADNIENEIVTPLTDAYRLAILAKMNAESLPEAERIAKFRAANRPHWLTWHKVLWLSLAGAFFCAASWITVFRTSASVHIRVTTQGAGGKPIPERPVPDAELDLISERYDIPRFHAKTDDQGVINLLNVPTGPYEWRLHARGFVERHGEELIVQPGDEILIAGQVSRKEFQITLWPYVPSKDAAYSVWRDARGNEHTEEELDRILDEHKKWAETVLGRTPDEHVEWADTVVGRTPCKLVTSKIEKVKDSDGELVSRANLAGAELYAKSANNGTIVGHDLDRRDLRCTNLKGARLLNADLAFAKLDYADLTDADLTGAMLPGASMVETEMKDADLSGAMVGTALFEPKSLPRMRGMASARYLEFITYRHHQDKLWELRKQFEDNGYREQERAIVYAIRKFEDDQRLQTTKEFVENCSPKYFIKGELDCGTLAYWARTALFDWTCGYGKSPLRPLKLILSSWLALALVYPLFMDRATARSKHTFPSGIYLVRKRTWNEDAALQQIRFAAHRVRTKSSRRFLRSVLRREWRLFRISVCFSLLSSFNIGFRDASVGVWLRMLTRREYDLKAVGWVRAISGFQSLLGVYLFALWALTFFGSPFA